MSAEPKFLPGGSTTPCTRLGRMGLGREDDEETRKKKTMISSRREVVEELGADDLEIIDDESDVGADIPSGLDTPSKNRRVGRRRVVIPVASPCQSSARAIGTTGGRGGSS